MLNGYHLQARFHASQVVDKNPSIPDVDLGVGFAEKLEPMNLIITRETRQPLATIPKLDEFSIEQATIDQQGAIFNETDFPKTHFLGSSIGGF